uniref:Fibrinogen C-terminal domain-containing protein n=1 Tax=Esox lucius TaxID=8010 RepID=A0A3P8YJ96_ESOLU
MGHPLVLVCLAFLSTAVIDSEKRQHRVQHGPCSYTFILPEVEHCLPSKDFQVTNSLQRDSPPSPDQDPARGERMVESLEAATENNTRWLQKLESYIQENVRSGMEEMKRSTVHTHTAAMLEIGTNLLSQSAEQTRKLTNVETQVLNQTSRVEIQLLEYSLVTNRLEKHILQQNQEISRLNDKNSFLEQRFSALETRHVKELQGIQREKRQLQELLERQSRLVTLLQGSSSLNSTLLQRQQAVLTGTVQQLLAMVTHCNDISTQPKVESVIFMDCAEIFRSGVTESGVYDIRPPNSTHAVKVFCDMQTRGGGWTVIQHRRDGAVDFHRDWRDYKMGFGDPSGEYWVGNDVIHLITTSKEYTLHVQLKDAEGNEATSYYDHFYIDAEDKNYSLHSRGFSGTAGRTSSLSHPGTMFSTKDRDNDRCSCKCAQMASGGWWFEACGPSNLNGIYYAGVSNVVRYNGIKWYYWKGPGLITTMSTMMVRPVDF